MASDPSSSVAAARFILAAAMQSHTNRHSDGLHTPSTGVQGCDAKLVCIYISPYGPKLVQITPAIDRAIYRPNSPSYQLQPSFHTQSTEPEPTARARRVGEEFY